MKRLLFVSVATALAVTGCQQANDQGNSQAASSKKEVVEVKASKTEIKSPAASPSPTKPSEKKTKKLGPKATADSYELSDACKIVSGTVLRIMRSATIKGELKSEKPPKAINFVVEGAKLDGHHPVVKLSIYDPAAKQWRELETFTAKGKLVRRYPLSNIPAGTVAFHVRYDDIDPHDGSRLRPDLLVHSAELEF